MKKRYFALALSLCLAVSPVLPVFATQTANQTAAQTEQTQPGATLTIATAEGFLAFAEKARLDSYTQNLTVELRSDIDLTGTDFQGVPIFCGTFLGNGYTISGLDLSAEGSDQGLFRYLTATARVRDLHVRGDVRPQGSRGTVGGIVGRNEGRILQCSFTGTVTAAENVGGIAGSNTVTGVVEDCRVTGTISGDHFLGGLVGNNQGVIRNCENNADINTTARQNQVSLADITLDSLTSTENAATVTDVGGIAGTSTGMIRDCVNWGHVGHKQMGYNVAGIVGSQSGTVLDCTNHGDISGRKEVGGIVGHLEPAAVVEYDEDALQILKRQLSALGNTVNQTSANIQTSASALQSQVNRMGNSVTSAWESVSLLIPDEENPELPDMDSLEAARNGLSDSLWELTGSVEGMSYATQGAMNTLSYNMATLQQQIAAMSATLNNVSDTVGGTIEDVSDQDTNLDLSGKVAGCSNYGTISADLNVGGIVGAMAMESDLNATSHLETLGERSLNFTSKIRSVVLECRNTGTVSGGKENVGGIVGFQTVGLIRRGTNTGTVGNAAASQVGGIAGRSNGYIRTSNAKCIVQGSTCVGGIAGSGAVVTDCRAMVDLRDAVEKVGAVLGIFDAPLMDTDDPVLDNWYSVQSRDPGGIDGVSYAGKAQGTALDDFVQLAGLPTLFDTVKLTFCFEDGTQVIRLLKSGGSLSSGRIPKLPEKQGYQGTWEGLEEDDLSCVIFDATFQAVYTALDSTIASQQTQGSQPVLLIQGGFQEDAAVTITEGTQMPAVQDDEWVDQCWQINVDGSQSITQARLYAGEQAGEDVALMVRLADGSWQERPFTASGSYLVFDMDGTETAVALVGREEALWPMYAIGAGAALAVAATVLLILKKRKK